MQFKTQGFLQSIILRFDIPALLIKCLFCISVMKGHRSQGMKVFWGYAPDPCMVEYPPCYCAQFH